MMVAEHDIASGFFRRGLVLDPELPAALQGLPLGVPD
jgi:hypothetical protein